MLVQAVVQGAVIEVLADVELDCQRRLASFVSSAGGRRSGRQRGEEVVGEGPEELAGGGRCIGSCRRAAGSSIPIISFIPSDADPGLFAGKDSQRNHLASAFDSLIASSYVSFSAVSHSKLLINSSCRAWTRA